MPPFSGQPSKPFQKRTSSLGLGKVLRKLRNEHLLSVFWAMGNFVNQHICINLHPPPVLVGISFLSYLNLIQKQQVFQLEDKLLMWLNCAEKRGKNEVKFIFKENKENLAC